MLEGLDSGEIRFLLLVGADPVRDVPDPRQAALALESAEYSSPSISSSTIPIEMPT